MTIHDEHPFADPEPDRDPVRRLRGRLGGAVSLWTHGAGAGRTGLTVSSLLVVAGEPAHVVGMVDPDSDLADALDVGEPLAVSLLTWPLRGLAEAFGGSAPAPGGPFRVAPFAATPWGPVPEGADSWAGARVVALRPLGWSLEVVAAVEHVAVGDTEVLVHRRGRYVRPAATDDR